MRIPRRHTFPQERELSLFVQAWYSKVHNSSLDSHRVRCMNSYSILGEMQKALSMLDIQNKIEETLKKEAEETLVIFEQDIVLQRFYATHIARVRPLLTEFASYNADDKTKNKINAALRNKFDYYVKDFLAELDLSYKKNLLISLDEALFTTKSVDDILKSTSLLLSKLADEGHSIEGLSWTRETGQLAKLCSRLLNWLSEGASHGTIS